MDKNILIIASSSELAKRTIEELKSNKNWNIFATSRSVDIIDDKVQKYNLDISKEEEFILLKNKLANIKFDVIINFAGIAYAGAVEEIQENDLKQQFDINVFGLLRIIKHLTPLLSKKGRLINVSSMASYGLFPFLSPYSMSKASADILLNTFEIETGIKTVSIRPGASATKFWESSIDLNKKNFNQKTKYQNEIEFLIENAQKNSLHATNPIYVAKKIAQIIDLQKPKNVYNIGNDAKIAKLTRLLPQTFTNKIVKFVLKNRLKKINGKKR